MLSTKIIYSNQHREPSLGYQVPASLHTRRATSILQDDLTFPDGRAKHTVEIRTTPGSRTARTSSQEHIVRGADGIGMAVSDVELPAIVPCRTR